MTDPVLPVGLEALRLLPEKWRKDADELDEAANKQWVEPSVLRQCADELEAVLSAEPRQQEPIAFDMQSHLQRQRDWSGMTFGPGPRTAGVIDHIRKELREIEADPTDISEWIDVVILALDGAWRAGYQPQDIIAALVAKQVKNENRDWPDWRTMPTDSAIEHVREATEPRQQEKQKMKLELHRCRICGTRWLLWPDAVHGGGWNLLDKYCQPGQCCNNVAMGGQIEHLRDFELEATEPRPPAAAVDLRTQLDAADEALGFGYFPSDGTGRVNAIRELRAALAAPREET